jgi:hypothetical protein
MAFEFSRDVEAIVGPLLEELGFVLDEIDDSPDEGGRSRKTSPYCPTSVKRYDACSHRCRSVDSCEQLLKSVVHAFGVGGWVG